MLGSLRTGRRNTLPLRTAPAGQYGGPITVRPIHKFAVDSRWIRESSRRIRKDSRIIREPVRDQFARIREQIRDEFARVRESSRRIYPVRDQFARIREKFARVREQVRKDSRSVRDGYASSRIEFARIRGRLTSVRRRIFAKGTGWVSTSLWRGQPFAASGVESSPPSFLPFPFLLPLSFFLLSLSLLI